MSSRTIYIIIALQKNNKKLAQLFQKLQFKRFFCMESAYDSKQWQYCEVLQKLKEKIPTKLFRLLKSILNQ